MEFRTDNNQTTPNAINKTVGRPKCEKVRLRRKPEDNNTNCVNHQNDNRKTKNSDSTKR